MPRILVSFIGRGRVRHEEGGLHHTEYETTVYKFGPDERYETSVFGWGLWQHLVHLGRAPDVWLVLGTTGSSWLALVGELQKTGALDDAAIDEALAWSDQVEKAAKEAQAAASPVRSPDQARLDAGQAGLPDLSLRLAAADGDTAGGPELCLALVGGAADLASQHDLMATMMKHLEPSAEDETPTVVLDITHAFRHMPVMASFLLTALHWLWGIQIEGIYYGAIEMPRGRDGCAEVVRLSICADYAVTAAAVATHSTTGSLSPMADVFPQAREDIEQAAFFEDINRLTRAKAPATKVLRALTSRPTSDPLAQAVAENLSPSLRWAEGGNLPGRMLARGCHHFNEGDYVKAATLVFEALLRHAAGAAAGKEGGQPRYDETARSRGWKWLKKKLKKQPDEWKQLQSLRRLRNILVHGVEPEHPASRKALKDRQAFETELGAGIESVRKVIDRMHR